MSPRASLLFLGLAMAMGLALFPLKYRVQELRDELARLHADIAAENQAIHVLKAEWSHLNDPAVLRALAQKHLGLDRLQAKQIGSLEGLPLRGASLVADQTTGNLASNPAAPTASKTPVRAARPAPPPPPMAAKVVEQRFEVEEDITGIDEGMMGEEPEGEGAAR